MGRGQRRDYVSEGRVVLPIGVGKDCEELGGEIRWIRVHRSTGLGKGSNGGEGPCEV